MVNILDSNNNKIDDGSLDKLLVLEEAKRLKTIFLDNMSHELRTPITVILGYAGILYEELRDPDLKEMAEIILKSSNRLTEALNLLLDQSDVETERLKVELKEENLFDFLKETVNVYKPVVEDKGLQINFNCEVENAKCKLDKKMFTKVMTNLLNNAIKFTEKGSISISLKLDDEKQNYIVEVEDTGIGIAKEKLSLIFEAFRQVSEGMNRLYQGIGLGLSVSKKFVEIMNGDLSVKSTLNKGTIFTIKIPAFS
ncbi:MAG: HAMP domain-containing histidine kinase [Ignavibacteriae bacterium]|nr:HAMP domain-containing histidine kinase [Ignavibacteriota bacterium]